MQLDTGVSVLAEPIPSQSLSISQSQDNNGRVTFALLFSVAVACLGTAFLHGYQIGVHYLPAIVIRGLYKKIYYERRGGTWENMEEYNNYLHSQRRKNYGWYDMEANDPDFSLNSPKQSPEDFGVDPTLELEEWEFKYLWLVTTSALYFFILIGLVLSEKVADRFGRKQGMMIITFLMFISAFLGGITLKVKSPECLILSQVFAGLHSGLGLILCPLYLAEISPKKMRGAMGACHQLAVTIGLQVSQIVSLKNLFENESQWPYLYAFSTLPAIICLVLMPLCPESPRFLFMTKGQEEDARQALIILRGTDNVTGEIEEMRLEARKSVGVKCCMLKEFLTNRELRMPVIIACVLQICKQWFEFITSFYNLVLYVSSFNLYERSINYFNYIYIGIGVFRIIIAIVAVPLMEKAGRRTLLLYPIIIMLVSFIAMLIFYYVQTTDEIYENARAFYNVCIGTIIIHNICNILSVGPIPAIVTGEICRQETRAAVLSLSTSLNWTFTCILMVVYWFFNIMNDQESVQIFMYVFTCICLASTITFVFFFVPETKGKSFDENANSVSIGKMARSRQQSYNINNDESEPMNTAEV